MQTLAVEPMIILNGMLPAKPDYAGGVFADFLLRKGIDWPSPGPGDRESDSSEASTSTLFVPAPEANPLSIFIKPGSRIGSLRAVPASTACSVAMTAEGSGGSGGTIAPSEQTVTQSSAGPVENTSSAAHVRPQALAVQSDLFLGNSWTQNATRNTNGEFVQPNQVQTPAALDSDRSARSTGLQQAPSGKEPTPSLETFPPLESSQPGPTLASRIHAPTGVPGEIPQAETAAGQDPDSSTKSPTPQSDINAGNETRLHALEAFKTIEPARLPDVLVVKKAGELSPAEDSSPAVEAPASISLQGQRWLPLQALAPHGSPHPPVIEEAMVVEQMVRSVRLLAGRDGGTIRMSLEPPELGTVRIRLDLSEDRARGWIETTSRSTQELIEHNLIQLRRSLENHGIHLESLVIRSEAQDTSLPRHHSPASSPDGQARDHNPANPETARQDTQWPETTAVTVGELTFLLGDPLWGWDLFA